MVNFPTQYFRSGPPACAHPNASLAIGTTNLAGGEPVRANTTGNRRARHPLSPSAKFKPACSLWGIERPINCLVT
jgi:hypothetical protein